MRVRCTLVELQYFARPGVPFAVPADRVELRPAVQRMSLKNSGGTRGQTSATELRKIPALSSLGFRRSAARCLAPVRSIRSSAWACSSAFAIARFPQLHDLEMVGPVVEAGGGPQFLRAKARYPFSTNPTAAQLISYPA